VFGIAEGRDYDSRAGEGDTKATLIQNIHLSNGYTGNKS
jgi:hypothetical protein